jgi:hypothetical protein
LASTVANSETLSHASGDDKLKDNEKRRDQTVCLKCLVFLLDLIMILAIDSPALGFEVLFINKNDGLGFICQGKPVIQRSLGRF